MFINGGMEPCRSFVLEVSGQSQTRAMIQKGNGRRIQKAQIS